MLLYELTGIPSNEYSLEQAVVFHDELNPALFQDSKLRTDVRSALLKIAEHFKNYIGIDLKIEDITISGSNAAYSYTKYSDLDLHLLVPVKDAAMRELLDAKKNNYNLEHDIKVKGIDVELYAQDVQQEHHSLGIYSVLNDRWISEPKKQRPTINDSHVKEKYRNYRDRIRTVIKTDDLAVAKSSWDLIKKIRKASLEKHGEFGEENLVYKMLRNQGWLAKLHDHINNLVSQGLSLEGWKL